MQGELYRSYDSFVDGRMYQSMGSEGSVTLHQAAQFIQVCVERNLIAQFISDMCEGEFCFQSA